ncbi:MAG: hypothetical protein L6R40_006894 [Gallowayella cf. fulva]|nr:MAG: hypothetical protein L6R40_006894 [Xanthomendoza cf. fulva]
MSDLLTAIGYVLVFVVWANLLQSWIFIPARKLLQTCSRSAHLIYHSFRRFLGLGFWVCGSLYRSLLLVLALVLSVYFWLVARAFGPQANSKPLPTVQRNNCPWNHADLWTYIESDADEDGEAKEESIHETSIAIEHHNQALEAPRGPTSTKSLVVSLCLPKSYHETHHSQALVCHQSPSHMACITASTPHSETQETTVPKRDILTLRKNNPSDDQAPNPSSQHSAQHPTPAAEKEALQAKRNIDKITRWKAERDMNLSSSANPPLKPATPSLGASDDDNNNNNNNSDPPTPSTPHFDPPTFWLSFSSGDESEFTDREPLISVAVSKVREVSQDRWASFSNGMGESESEVLDRFEATLCGREGEAQ